MTADRLAAPMTRSPPQCPGTARSAASAGRRVIRVLSGIVSRPAVIARRWSRLTRAVPPRRRHPSRRTVNCPRAWQYRA